MIRLMILFLLFSFSASAQFTPIAGKQNFKDSLMLSKYKNNHGEDSVLTTDTSGKVKFKKVSSGGGSTNTSIGSAFKIAVNGTNNVKSLSSGFGILLDSATTGQVNAKADTAAGKLATKTDLDGKASTALSNLASVAINLSLLPGTTNTIDLGSASKTWRSIYLPNTGSTSTDGIIYKGGNRFIHDYHETGTDGENSFFGNLSGPVSASGGTGIQNSYNVGFGAATFRYNTLGNRGTAIGTYALDFNTTGVNNTALGYASMYTNTTGFNNTALGLRTLTQNTSGTSNTAVGLDASNFNTTGSFNVSAGIDALYQNTTGSFNVGIGDSTAWIHTVGIKNTFVGSRAGYYLGDTYSNFASVKDSNSTFIGADATRDSSIANTTALKNITVIGYNAKGTASNQVTIGNSSVTQHVFYGALMPNKLPGTSGQVLTSAGANTSPTWTSISSSYWSTLGNSGLASGSYFLGTTDNKSLRIRTNNIERMVIDSSGFVGIGTETPAYQLDVNSGGVFAARFTIPAYTAGILIGNSGNYESDEIGLVENSNQTSVATYSNTGGIYRYGNGLITAVYSSQNVGIGVTNPTSQLHTTSFAASIITTGTDYTVTATDYTVIFNGSFAGSTITLPSASGISGRIYTIKTVDAAVDVASSDNIDGSATYTLSAQYKYVTVQSNGTTWWVIGNN